MSGCKRFPWRRPYTVPVIAYADRRWCRICRTYFKSSNPQIGILNSHPLVPFAEHGDERFELRTLFVSQIRRRRRTRGKADVLIE